MGEIKDLQIMTTKELKVLRASITELIDKKEDMVSSGGDAFIISDEGVKNIAKDFISNYKQVVNNQQKRDRCEEKEKKCFWCDSVIHARGLCNKHYQEYYKSKKQE